MGHSRGNAKPSFRSTSVGQGLSFDWKLAMREACLTLLYPVAIVPAFFIDGKAGVYAREYLPGVSEGKSFIDRNFIFGGQLMVSICTCISAFGILYGRADIIADGVLADVLAVFVLVWLRATLISAKWGYMGGRTAQATLKAHMTWTHRRGFESIFGWFPLPPAVLLKHLFQTYRRLGLDPSTPILFRDTSVANVRRALRDGVEMLPSFSALIDVAAEAELIDRPMSRERSSSPSGLAPKIRTQLRERSVPKPISRAHDEMEHAANETRFASVPPASPVFPSGTSFAASVSTASKWSLASAVDPRGSSQSPRPAEVKDAADAEAPPQSCTVACPSVLYLVQLLGSCSHEIQQAEGLAPRSLLDKPRSIALLKLVFSVVQAALPIGGRLLVGLPPLGSSGTSCACVLACAAMQLAVGYNFVNALVTLAFKDLQRRLFWQRSLGLLLYNDIEDVRFLRKLGDAALQRLTASGIIAPSRESSSVEMDPHIPPPPPREAPASTKSRWASARVAAANRSHAVAPMGVSTRSLPRGGSRSTVVLSTYISRYQGLETLFASSETASDHNKIHTDCRMEGDVNSLAFQILQNRGFDALRLDPSEPRAVATFTQIHEVLVQYGIVFHLRVRVLVACLLLLAAAVAGWLVFNALFNSGNLSASYIVYTGVGGYCALVACAVVMGSVVQVSKIQRQAARHVEALNVLKVTLSQRPPGHENDAVQSRLLQQQALTDAMRQIENAEKRSPVSAAGTRSSTVVFKAVGAIIAATLGTIGRRIASV